MSRNRDEMRHRPGDLRGFMKQPREHRKAGDAIPRPCEKELATSRQTSSVSLTGSQMRPERSGVGQIFHRALPLNCFKENPGSKQMTAVSIQPFISLNKQAGSRLGASWESSSRQQASLEKREQLARPPFSRSMGHMCTMQIQPLANQTLS